MNSTLLFQRRLTRNTGVGILVVLLLLAAGGWLTDRAIMRQERASVGAMLEAMLATSARSATSWLDDRREFLALLPRTPRIRQAVAAVLAGDHDSPLLREVLADFATPFKFHHCLVVDVRGNVVFAVEDPKAQGKPLPDAVRPWLARAWKGDVCISPPLLADLGTGETPLMFGLTRVPGPDGSPAGVLVLTIDPLDFSTLLDQTRPGKSGETEAFDREGRMICQSRFLDEIVAAGVLPAGTKSTVLTLDLRNPGVDIRTGKRSDLPVKAQPLTAMVASAVSGGSGLDVDGYNDYRGVPCVAAWQWIPAYDFGLAVKMDYAEAFKTVYTLRAIFLGLMGLLVLAALGMVGWYYVHAREQRRLAEAQSKVERLGQYQLERKLGEGGMGEVYLGHHALLRRPTAIKLMRRASADDDRLRFEQEVKLGCRLTHPNTIAIFDYGHTVDGVFYYAMEYLDGMDLGKMVERFGPLPPGRVVHLLAQVCGSLAEAHELNMIHRDIKPENIMACLRGGVPDAVKVLDFGLVKSLDAHSPRITASATICGTPAYMAPEMIGGDVIDGRVDLYSVAGVAYFLLTGKVMFDRPAVMDTLMAQLGETPLPPTRHRPEVPLDLERVVLKGLEKKPENRQASARAFRAELLACACAADWSEDAARRWWDDHAAKVSEANQPLPVRAVQVATPTD